MFGAELWTILRSEWILSVRPNYIRSILVLLPWSRQPAEEVSIQPPALAKTHSLSRIVCCYTMFDGFPFVSYLPYDILLKYPRLSLLEVLSGHHYLLHGLPQGTTQVLCTKVETDLPRRAPGMTHEAQSNAKSVQQATIIAPATSMAVLYDLIQVAGKIDD
jgi:hypothetical protein